MARSSARLRISLFLNHGHWHVLHIVRAGTRLFRSKTSGSRTANEHETRGHRAPWLLEILVRHRMFTEENSYMMVWSKQQRAHIRHSEGLDKQSFGLIKIWTAPCLVLFQSTLYSFIVDWSELGAELYGLSIHIHKCRGKSECMKRYYAMSTMEWRTSTLWRRATGGDKIALYEDHSDRILIHQGKFASGSSRSHCWFVIQKRFFPFC